MRPIARTAEATFLLSAWLLAGLTGCGSTSDPPPGPVDAGQGSDSGPDAGGESNDASVAACSAASDCRLFEDRCGACSCLALLASEPDPVCRGDEVSCFAPSCPDKVAACVDGRCVAR